VISGLLREADENCALVGYYAASDGNSLPTLRDNLSVPSSRVKNPKVIVVVVFTAEFTSKTNHSASC